MATTTSGGQHPGHGTSTDGTTTPATPGPAPTPASHAPPGTPPEPALRVELLIDGMTCASCAARVQKKLNRMEGVTAGVNYATEHATVTATAGVSVSDLIATVEAAGYTATEPEPEPGPDGPGPRPAPRDAPGGPQGESGGAAGGGPRPPRDAALTALRRRLVTAVVLAVPVVATAMVPALQFRYWQWVSLVLTVPVVAYAGLPFHRAAWTNLRHGAATMDTLVSVGTLAAFGWSMWALFLGGAGEPGLRDTFALTVSRGMGDRTVYLEAAAGVTAFILAGRYAETRSKRRAGAALRALMELGARDAAVLRDGREVRVPVSRLAVGDRFVVRPGEKVATDGVVREGESAIDAAMLTGESVPVDVGPGAAVAGATVNGGGRIVVEATKVGADTQLARMARLVADAQNGKAAAQRLADRVSAVFVPAVIVVALGTLAAWLLLGGGVTAAFTAAVAVLIIACPCALGLATPTALMVGTGRGAQLGILIRGPEVLEMTRRVDTVVLDKTGTVTTGVMTLDDVRTAGGVDAAEALRLAGAVEDASEHPIGRAVARAAREAGPLPPVTDFRTLPGSGVRGTVEGRVVTVGRAEDVLATVNSAPGTVPRTKTTPTGGAASRPAAASVPAASPAAPGGAATLVDGPGGPLTAALREARAAGRTAVVAAWDGRPRAVISVADAVRPTSAEAVRRLRALGLRPVLLTGDHADVARAVAERVGIAPQDVLAEVLPEEKVAAVERLQAGGRTVAMVGDGVNDAAALARADLGLAMGTGTDAAIEAGDLTLVRGDLLVAADAVRLARRTLRIIRSNLFWAFGYNVAAVPLAALGLLNPMIAGAAMAFSSVFVVGNSLRLRTFRPLEDGGTAGVVRR